MRSALRLAVCEKCEYVRKEKPAVWFCSKCNCPPLQMKATLTLAKCPSKKW
jgi:hypothetical protein